MPAPPAAEPQVWYVSYGSNMSRARLGCYLEGGCPPGATTTYVGARNPAAPVEAVPVDLPGRLYFAGDSPVWGGGVAFYDPDVPGPTAARAYRITAQQFADVAAQEMHRIPEEGDPLEEVVIGGLPEERHTAGPGHYETLVEVGQRDGLPMLTFTAPHGWESVPHSPPSEAYLAMLAEGLADSRDWDARQVDDYLAAVSDGGRPTL